MTVRELIAQLQALGEANLDVDVVCGNEPIHFVSIDGAYYDGAMQRVIRNDAGRPVAAKFVRTGFKAQIHTCPIEWVLLDYPELPVDTTEAPNCAAAVERWRKESREAVGPRLGRECEHGSLARQCDRCEMQAELVAARKVVEAARAFLGLSSFTEIRRKLQKALDAYDKAVSK